VVWTTGPKVQQFEEDFANHVGCQHAVAVNSATAALHLALGAIGIEEDDEILVPTMTFAATAEVVLYFKARPVLVDCRRDTFISIPIRLSKQLRPKRRLSCPSILPARPATWIGFWRPL
jgi:dTDP-4-amino-4,6-dideoxygalactose transaminase